MLKKVKDEMVSCRASECTNPADKSSNIITLVAIIIIIMIMIIIMLL